MTISLRPASQEDARLLFEWANDVSVRAQSFASDAIAWDQHREWFQAKLGAPDACRIFIGSTSTGEPVGVVRFERSNTAAVLSYSLDAAHRGKGLAAPLLQAGLDSVLSAWPDVQSVEAAVKPDNTASVRALTRVGFVEDRRESGRVTLVRHVHGGS